MYFPNEDIEMFEAVNSRIQKMPLWQQEDDYETDYSMLRDDIACEISNGRYND